MAPKALEPPSPAALKAQGRAELRALAAALGKADARESVHGARRRIKRLRSLLRLLRRPLGEKAYVAINTALREAADHLAGQRRAEALICAAQAMAGQKPALKFWVEIAEAHRNAHAAGQQGEGGLAAARGAAARAGKALGSSRLRTGTPEDVREALLSDYAKARSELARAFLTGNAQTLHTARKHVIHHLHHVSLLAAHLQNLKKRPQRLEELRELLGSLNDLDELSGIAAAQGQIPCHASSKAMEKTRAALMSKGEALAARLFRLKSRAYAKRIGAMWPSAHG